MPDGSNTPESIGNQNPQEQTTHRPNSSSLRVRIMNTARTAALAFMVTKSNMGKPAEQPFQPPIEGDSAITQTIGDNTGNSITQRESIAKNAKRSITRTFDEVGDNPLEFDQAKKLSSYVIRIFSTVGKRFTKDELENRFFIVEDPFTPKDHEFNSQGGYSLDPFNSPVFERLKKDYPEIIPDVDITRKNIESIYELFSEGHTFGFTEDDRSFTYLPANNESPEFGESWDLQFNNFQDTKCTEATPAVMEASTELHEFFHLNVEPVLKTGDQGFEEAEELFDTKFEVASVDIFGFSIFLNSNDHTVYKYVGGLEEFVAQHLSNLTSIKYGIPMATLGINAPKDSANFQAILDQPGISLEDLERYHRTSDLEGFLEKVERSVSGQEFISREDAIKSALRRFAPLINGQYDWAIGLDGDFPGVDAKYYETNKRPNLISAFPGCGVPKTMLNKIQKLQNMKKASS